MIGIDDARPFKAVNICLVTISDTRSLADDKSGDTLEKLIKHSGHNCLSRNIVKDDIEEIKLSLIHISEPTRPY